MTSFRQFSCRTKRRKISEAVSQYFDDSRDIANNVSDISTLKFEIDVSMTTSNRPIDKEFDCVNKNVLKCSPVCSTGCDIDEMYAVHNDANIGWTTESIRIFEEELESGAVDGRQDPEEDNDVPSINKEDLADWAIKHKISHSALHDLLSVLRKQLSYLPKDPRTLLSTPRQLKVAPLAGGSYHYLGIESFLSKNFQHVIGHDAPSSCYRLKLQINIDGLPLFKSSSVSLWPILGLFTDTNMIEPFPIALFCGRSKPASVHEFMKDFVSEMQLLTSQGLQVDGKKVEIVLDAVVCDAPARAMVKCIKGHTAYNSCERCMIKGKWLNKMTFPVTHSQLRTDESFQLQSDPSHHVGVSPLTKLPFGLVSQIPLDHMHVVFLGVMRRLILLWTSGPLSCRMSNALTQAVSGRLVMLRPFISKQFARKPRALKEVKMWKATEFRTFLLYTGPVALKGLLDNKLYSNFMLLSVAIALCLNPELCQTHADYCEKLLNCFVKQFSQLYGDNQVVYNVHCLTHLVQDVRRFGSLQNVSAFPFENYLGKLKTLIRKPDNPIAQVVNRLIEKANLETLFVASAADAVEYKKCHNDGPVPFGVNGYEQYKQYKSKKIFLSCKFGDNCVQVGNKIGLVRNILRSADGECCVVFSHFEQRNVLFDQPLSSKLLGIYSLSHLSETCTVHTCSAVSRKYILLPLPCGTAYAGFPMLHGLDAC